MKVKLEPLPDGRVMVPFNAEDLHEKTGWKIGDEIVIHAAYGGTLLLMRVWNRGRKESE